MELRLCQRPEDVPEPDTPWDVGVCLETFEHVPPDLVEPYLERMASIVRGHFFVTVPVERGPVFFGKHFAKKVLRLEDDPYTLREFLNCSLSRLDRVTRREHKGFDERELERQVGKYFKIERSGGVYPRVRASGWTTAWGIVATSVAISRRS